MQQQDPRGKVHQQQDPIVDPILKVHQQDPIVDPIVKLHQQDPIVDPILVKVHQQDPILLSISFYQLNTSRWSQVLEMKILLTIQMTYL